MAKTAAAADPENTLIMELKNSCKVTIDLRPELAPKTVARFKELTRKGFYNGVVFHRVIDGFMAQTGDPRGDGTGGSGQNINAEFNSGRHVRGALSMARSSNINSADSQFFILLADSPHIKGQFTYWGEVISGMDAVDHLAKGNTLDGMVDNPDRILKMGLLAD